MPHYRQHFFLILHFTFAISQSIITFKTCKTNKNYGVSLESSTSKCLFINTIKSQSKYLYNSNFFTLKCNSSYLRSNTINTSISEIKLSKYTPLSTRNRLHATYDNYNYLSNLVNNVQPAPNNPNNFIALVKSQFYGLGGSLFKIINVIFYKIQVVSLATSYIIYNFYLSNLHITFPYQLIPNNLGLFNSIGLDTLASIIGILYLIKTNDWKGFMNKLTKKTTKLESSAKKMIIPVSGLLISIYILSGHASVLVEMILHVLNEFGFNISLAMERSLQVFIGHILWISMGSIILSKMLNPFFPPEGKWYSKDFNDNWMAKSIIGYMISTLLFNITDVITTSLTYSLVNNNHVLEMGDNVVTSLTDPTGNDVAAMLVGSFGPCVTAAWWEEVIYRGFVSKSLNAFLYPIISMPIAALLFSAHHLNILNSPHLFVLGLIWELINLQYENLIITMTIHSLWNTRVFLASILGL